MRHVARSGAGRVDVGKRGGGHAGVLTHTRSTEEEAAETGQG